MTKYQQQLLEQNGWEIECESPLEIRTKDGSFASGEAALRVVHSLSIEQESEDSVLTNVATIIVNARKKVVTNRLLTYDDVLMLADIPRNQSPSVTYHNAVSDRDGCLYRGKSVIVKDGTIISACDTSNA
jgi:hypothetical protein